MSGLERKVLFMAEETNATSTNTSQDAQNASQDTQTKSTTVNSTTTEKGSQDKSKDTSIEDLIQRAVDRATQKLGTDNKKLREDLAALQKEKLTADELKALELKEKEADIADREAKLQEKINREFAMKAIKDAGLDDGGSNSLKLIDFVVCDTEENTLERVTAFKELVDTIVKAEVDKTFKINGRNPNSTTNVNDSKNAPNIAEQLGKTRADSAKKSNDILKHYLGGN